MDIQALLKDILEILKSNKAIITIDLGGGMREIIEEEEHEEEDEGLDVNNKKQWVRANLIQIGMSNLLEWIEKEHPIFGRCIVSDVHFKEDGQLRMGVKPEAVKYYQNNITEMREALINKAGCTALWLVNAEGRGVYLYDNLKSNLADLEDSLKYLPVTEDTKMSEEMLEAEEGTVTLNQLTAKLPEHLLDEPLPEEVVVALVSSLYQAELNNFLANLE